MSSTTRTTRKVAGGAVGFLIVMEFGSGLLQGWFPPLLSRIGSDFGVEAAALNWVMVIYLLMTVAFVPIIGKLGDLYGHKKMLLITVCLVAAGSLLVAFAPSFTWLLVGRALQAPLGAFLPLEFAIVRSRDEGSAGRSIGKLVGALTLGGALGAMFSGVLLSAFDDLTLVLLAPALFLVLCIPVVAWLVPESSTRTAGTIDWAGAVLLTAGLLSALLGISNAATWGWDSAATWGTIIGGLVLLVLWVRVEGRVAYPLIDLKVLTGTGIGLPIVAAAFFGAQMFGSQTAGSLFIMTDPNTYGFGLGLGSSAIGLLFLVLALMTFIGTTQADRIGSKIGARAAIIAGSVLSALSFGGMILMADNATAFMVSMAIGAFGNGLILGLLPAIVVRKSPADSVAIASALYNTTRTASGSVSGAVFALVMSSALVTVTVDGTSSTVSADSTYVAVWIICAVLSLGVALLALRFRDTPTPAGAPAESTPVAAAAAEGE
ncbi:MFS transporter [Glutamicibacter soli]|uniref:MFS transporter n=1 Tax=Glutamicibacter soli TaxID=453836 RepID=A0A365YGY6_9MICC|nr:MFS transporter [Glutamicibacter soli]RBM01677.1 MFS transporter [Glutamicibacter soli]